MCESSAYMLKDEEEHLVFETVEFLESRDHDVRMTNIFGEEKTISAKVKRLSLVDHKIILEPL